MKAIKLTDGELYYDEKGAGPALILIHAGIADSRMWKAQIEPLAEHFRTVWCDLRGYGNSLFPEGQYSYTQDILDLINVLDLAPVWIIGASFGGQVAIDFCLSYPDKVSGLILISPAISGFKPSAEIEQFGETEDALLEAGKLKEATELNMRMWVDGPFRTKEQIDPEMRKRVAEMQLHAFSQPEPENTSLLKLDPPAIMRLDEINRPLLVISGELDAPAFVELAKTIGNRVAEAKRVIIPNTAHMINMEVPLEFNQLVIEFVSSYESNPLA